MTFDDNWKKMFKDDLQKAFLGGLYRPPQVDYNSTIAQTENTLKRDDLLKALADMNRPDPLEEKGIGRDWVAVIHPAMIKPLMDAYEKEFSASRSPLLPEWEKLRHMLSRKTYIENHAPTNKIEYMTELMYAAKYGRFGIASALRNKMWELRDQQDEIFDDMRGLQDTESVAPLLDMVEGFQQRIDALNIQLERL